MARRVEKRIIGNRATHQVGDSHNAVRAGLPGHDRHLLLDGLHVGRVVRLRAIAKADDALRIIADLGRPVLPPLHHNRQLSASDARCQGQMQHAAHAKSAAWVKHNFQKLARVKHPLAPP